MAKKSMIEREKKRMKLHKKYALKRDNLLKKYQTSESFNSKLEIHSKLQKLPRNSSKTRIRNRCWKTGRANGVYRFVGLCRNMFRYHAMRGDIPGIRKASW